MTGPEDRDAVDAVDAVIIPFRQLDPVSPDANEAAALAASSGDRSWPVMHEHAGAYMRSNS